MQYEEKLKLLKSLHLLRQMPERQLASLAEFLRPKQLEDGAAVFEEGSQGMSLYFISSGRIRIHMRGAGGASKDLAILCAGDFFGEMALIEEATRSASASAMGPTVLFELFRGDLSRWVKLNPQQAVQFFAGLVHLQSKRLRRTSNELTLHFDLSSLLLDAAGAGPEFMARALDCILARLEGPWSAAAYLCREADGALEPASSRGSFDFSEAAKSIPPGEGGAGAWLDPSTLRVALPGQKRVLGHLLVRAPSPRGAEEQEDIGRAMAT
ncbi:MAG: cyclic nucleotide-binding domain-containing protein, partial [Elusimicrobia bacterium]|nr:cyclic nucleotide-binding domain-containing protein [Elusimicrobiota bacterium]